MGCHFLLQGIQGIFQTQGLNPHLLHGQMDSLLLSHRGGPYFRSLLIIYFISIIIILYQLFWGTIYIQWNAQMLSLQFHEFWQICTHITNTSFRMTELFHQHRKFPSKESPTPIGNYYPNFYYWRVILPFPELWANRITQYVLSVSALFFSCST